MRALVLLAVLAAGCASTSGVPDYQVRIETSERYGHGVLLDERHVLTVHHVAPSATDTYFVSKARQHVPGQRRRAYQVRSGRVIRYFGFGDSAEPLALLRLDKALPADVYPKLRPVEPGDSGSPILGKQGILIGLVSMMGRNGRGLIVIGTVVPNDVAVVPPKREEEEE